MSENISANWFRDVIEPLADSFDRAAVDEYVTVFSRAIGRPELNDRYQKVRGARKFQGPDPAEVFVLSRVTLGADVAITSLVLDAVRRRFPAAKISFVAPAKNFQLFEAAPRISHVPVTYRRSGTLAERLNASISLAVSIDRPNSIVVDPDSRLTQLGLIPVCDPAHYYFFESRSATGRETLGHLTSDWLQLTFGVSGEAFIAPQPVDVPVPAITVSLGVGENYSKRIGDPFERRLLERLSATGQSVLVDEGAGGDETERVTSAIAGLPNVSAFRGSFAAFASLIARSKLYVGYDSAGQHVAAACGVPLITVFAGFPNERFFERWRPSGSGRIDVVRVDFADPAAVLEQVTGLIDPRP